jgi:hypothetical protein
MKALITKTELRTHVAALSEHLANNPETTPIAGGPPSTWSHWRKNRQCRQNLAWRQLIETVEIFQRIKTNMKPDPTHPKPNLHQEDI